ncbi:Cytochrome P450_ family 2 subfamily j_ polypeptide 6, partial [Caligus rogercresseyi]
GDGAVPGDHKHGRHEVADTKTLCTRQLRAFGFGKRAWTGDTRGGSEIHDDK